MLVAIAGCGGSSQTPSSAPLAGLPAASCGLASALHEHQLHDDATLRATVGTSLVGRLETSDGVPHEKDSGNAGSDAIAYRIEQATTLRLGVAAGGIARIRLVDASGTTIAEARAGDAPVTVDLSRGEYMLVLHSADTRELHYLVQRESCRAGASRVSAQASSVAAAYEHPGVYVQELPNGTAITAAATSTTAFVGAIGSGPVGQPVELTDASDLATQFGAAAADSLVGRAVAQFFANGGSVAWVVGTTGTTPAELLGTGAGGGGLAALAGITGWSLLVLPDVATLSPGDATTVLASAVPFAANASAFTIVDPPLALADADAVIAWTSGSLIPALPEAARPYAAAYYPPLVIEDASGETVTMGASGTVAGIYAFTDAQSGVWQQPTGPISAGPNLSVAPAAVLDDTSVAALNAALVNSLRSTSLGDVVWGSRTLVGVSDPRGYVGSSRTDLMLRTSITESLQWVVFEPDDPTLWATVTATVSSFLTTLWQQGALYGTTAADAFAVTCDASNNPPDQIELGQLLLDVQIALSAPGELMLQRYTFLTAGPDS